jgi:Nucleotidyltransferase substrate binding protein like
MEMIEARNLTAHTYDEALADDVLESIVHKFFPAFESLTAKFTSLHEQEHE